MKPFPNSGFTLIELMIVIAIIGTLAGIATPNYINFYQKVLQTDAMTEFKMIENEIMSYHAENGFYPESLADIGLEKLKDPWGNPYQYLRIENPPDDSDSKGKGKDKDKDKGGGATKGKPRKDHFMVPVNTDFDLYSMGPDGKSVAPFTAQASRDDIVRANNGQYIGLASEY